MRCGRRWAYPTSCAPSHLSFLLQIREIGIPTETWRRRAPPGQQRRALVQSTLDQFHVGLRLVEDGLYNFPKPRVDCFILGPLLNPES